MTNACAMKEMSYGIIEWKMSVGDMKETNYGTTAIMKDVNDGVMKYISNNYV